MRDGTLVKADTLLSSQDRGGVDIFSKSPGGISMEHVSDIE